MYFGSNPNHYSCLVGYVTGFTNGYCEADGAKPIPSAAFLVPEGFSTFVAQHFGQSTIGGTYWRHWIRHHSASEEEAFSTFFELLSSYYQQHPPVA